MYLPIRINKHGELAPLVAHYAKHRTLSSDEVARLKRLIAKFDDGD